MTEESIASLLSHPLGLAVLSVIIAAITAAVTVKLLAAQRPAAAGPGARPVAVAKGAAPATDDGTIIAVIAAAAAHTLGAHRILYIGEAQTGSGWAAQLRSRHHASHMPQKRTATDHRAAARRGDDTP